MTHENERQKAHEKISDHSPPVIIVDDSEGLNRLIRKVLQREGFLVQQAFTGEQALTLGSQYPKSIMLLDYVLPDMTAPEVIDRLRSQACELPFIMMTGQGDEQVAVEMMKLGARDYIVKQGNFLETLPRKLRRVMNEVEQQQRIVRAEQALKESERRFRETLEYIEMIALMLDREGHVTFCNAHLLQVLGKRQSEVLGRNWFRAFLPPEIQHAMETDFLEKLARGEVYPHYENEILCAAGERRLIAWSNMVLRDAGGNIIGMNSLGEDVTERRQTENHLRQLRKAVETMHLGVTISDLNRKIVYTNPADAGMHGYTVEELIGRHAGLFAPPELQHPLTVEDIEKGRNWLRESLNIRKDGSRFPVQLSSDIVRDAEGRPIAIVTTCEDITGRKRAEEIMVRERNLLRTLIDNLPDYIFVKDTKERFLLSNAAYNAFLGAVDPDGLIGTTIDDYVSGEVTAFDKQTDRSVLQSGVPILAQEKACANSDGQSEWRLVTKIPLKDSEETIIGLVGISRNIDEQKQTQTALECQTEELSERIKELNCLFQLSHLTEDGTLSLKDMLAQAVNLLPPAWKYPDITYARICVNEEQVVTQNFLKTPWMLESRIISDSHPVGSVQVGYLVEQPDEYEGPFLQEERSLIDMVAERLGELLTKKQAEEALRESREFLRSTLDSLAAHIAILNDIGDIVEVNASWKRFARKNDLRREDYYVGHNYLTVCDNAHGEFSAGAREAAQAIRAVIRQEQETFYQEYPCHSPTLQRWFAMRVTRFQSHGSIRIVIAHENISERKLAENALQKTMEQLESRVRERTAELLVVNERLERASRLKDEFLANMSHELRTPLNAILGYAQLLKNAENLTGQQQEALKTVKNSGDHLLSMINEILDLSKIEAGHMTLQSADLHLPHFLKGLAEMIRIRAEQKGILFHYEPGANLPKGIRVDETRLREVLLNLLGNAVKFTEQGSVTFRVTSPGEAVRHSPLPRRRSSIRFEVEDSGPGIAPEHVREIFLPFHQIQSRHNTIEGTGLGLTISQKLVGMMGSKLQLTSSPGKGSRFWFTIDAQEAPDVTLEEERTLPGIVGYAGSPRTILVVDDIAGNRAILSSLLQPLGFRVAEAANGKEGLEHTFRVQPDLILLDLLMPGIDGFECVRRIRHREQFSDMPIIAISASAFDEIRQRSLQAGCDDFLAKPFKIDELLGVIQQHLSLEWIYKESQGPQSGEDRTLKNPHELWRQITEHERRELLDRAMRGNVKAILQQIEALESRGEILLPLMQKLRGMVRKFQVDQLIEYIQQLQQTEGEDG